MKYHTFINIPIKLILILNLVCFVSFSNSKNQINQIVGQWKIQKFKIIKHPQDCDDKTLNYISSILQYRTKFYFFNNETYVDFSVDGLELGFWKFLKKEKFIVKKACNGKVDTLKLNTIKWNMLKGTYSSAQGFYLRFEMKKIKF